MQPIQTEKYSTIDRDFEIITFKDSNNDELVINSAEVTKGTRQHLPYTSRVPMNGNWHLQPHEYEGYSDQLAAVKQSIIIYTKSNFI
jgi:hypothetical protein